MRRLENEVTSKLIDKCNYNIKQNELNLHLKDLIGIEEDDENEFIKLMKEEQSRDQKPIDIVDIKKKFHLKILTKKSKLYNTVFGSMSGLTTLIITIIIGILLYRCSKRKRKQTTPNEGIAFYQIPSGAAEVHTPNQNIQKTEEEPVNGNKLNIKAILSE